MRVFRHMSLAGAVVTLLCFGVLFLVVKTPGQEQSPSITGLASENETTRRSASGDILAERAKLIRDTVTLALSKMDDPAGAETARDAILLLGHLRAAEAVPFLVEHMEFSAKPAIDKDMDFGGSHPCIAALIEIGAPSIEPVIEHVAKDGERADIRPAVWILGGVLGRSTALALLENRLNEPGIDVKALVALTRVQDTIGGRKGNSLKESASKTKPALLTIAPEIESIYPGEPLFLKLTVFNADAEALTPYLGDDPDRVFRFRLIDPIGLVVSEAGPPTSRGGLRGVPLAPAPLAKGESFTQDLLLNRWCSTYLPPGTYTCELTVHAPPDRRPPGIAGGRIVEGNFRMQCQFEVKPMDEVALRAKFKEWIGDDILSTTEKTRSRIRYANSPFATEAKLKLLEKELGDEFYDMGATAMVNSGQAWDVEALMAIAEREGAQDTYKKLATNAVHQIHEKNASLRSKTAAFVRTHPRVEVPVITD